MNPNPHHNNNADTLASIFQNFIDFNLNNCEVSLFLGADLQNNGVFTFAEVQLSNKLANQFRNFMNTFQHEKSVKFQKDNFLLQPFDFEATGDEIDIEYESFAQAPDIEQIIASLQVKPTIFQENDAEFIHGLKFAIFCCTAPSQKSIYFLQKYSSRKIMRKSLSIHRLLNNDVYDLLDTPLLQFDEVVHTVIWETHILIFDHAAYMHIFREGPHIQSIANQALEAIKQFDIFEQFDEFANSCQKDSRKLTKLYIISKKNRLESISRLDLQSIQNIIEKYQLNICAVAYSTRWRLQFQNKSIWHALKLLADDYALSEITGNRYEIYGKRNIP